MQQDINIGRDVDAPKARGRIVSISASRCGSGNMHNVSQRSGRKRHYHACQRAINASQTRVTLRLYGEPDHALCSLSDDTC